MKRGVKEEQDVDTALKILTRFNEFRLWQSEKRRDISGPSLGETASEIMN